MSAIWAVVLILEVFDGEMNCWFLKVTGQSKKVEQIMWTVKRESRTEGRATRKGSRRKEGNMYAGRDRVLRRRSRRGSCV